MLQGHLETPLGVCVPLVQSAAPLIGKETLTEVNHQQVTLCGPLRFENGMLALEVTYVNSGSRVSSPAVSPLSLTVLALMGLLPVCN